MTRIASDCRATPGKIDTMDPGLGITHNGRGSNSMLASGIHMPAPSRRFFALTGSRRRPVARSGYHCSLIGRQAHVAAVQTSQLPGPCGQQAASEAIEVTQPVATA